jgi:hypothetical protein
MGHCLPRVSSSRPQCWSGYFTSVKLGHESHCPPVQGHLPCFLPRKTCTFLLRLLTTLWWTAPSVFTEPNVHWVAPASERWFGRQRHSLSLSGSGTQQPLSCSWVLCQCRPALRTWEITHLPQNPPGLGLYPRNFSQQKRPQRRIHVNVVKLTVACSTGLSNQVSNKE